MVFLLFIIFGGSNHFKQYIIKEFNLTNTNFKFLLFNRKRLYK